MPRTRRTKTPILRRRNSIDSTPITDIAEGTVTVTGGSFYPISRRLRGVRVREHGTEIHLHRHSTPNGASPRRTRASTRLQKNSLSPNIHSHREPSPVTPRSNVIPKSAKRKKKTARTNHLLEIPSAPDESESGPNQTERVQMTLESRFDEHAEPNNHEPDSPKACRDHFHLIVRNVSIFILVFPLLIFFVNYRLKLPLVNQKQAEGKHIYELSKVSTDNVSLIKLLAIEKNEENVNETTSKRLQRELDTLKTMIRYSDKKHQSDIKAMRKEIQDGIANDKVHLQQKMHELHLGIEEMKQKFAELMAKNGRDISDIRQNVTKILDASRMGINNSEKRIVNKFNELAKEVDTATESALSSAQKIALISDGVADLNKTISEGTLSVAEKYRVDFETAKNNVLEAVHALRLNDESMANNLSDVKMTLGDHEKIIKDHSSSLNTQTNELHSIQQSVKDIGMDLENKLQPFKDQISNCTTHLNATFEATIKRIKKQINGTSQDLKRLAKSAAFKSLRISTSIAPGITEGKVHLQQKMHELHLGIEEMKQKFAELMAKNGRDISDIRQNVTKILDASRMGINNSEKRIVNKFNELAKEVDTATESALSSSQKIALISDGIADFNTAKNNVLEAVHALRLNDESMANNLSDVKMALGDHEKIIKDHSSSLNTQTKELHSVQQSVKDIGMDLENKLQPFKDQVSNCTTHLHAISLEVQTRLHQSRGLKSKKFRKELNSIRSSVVKQMKMINNIMNEMAKLDQDQETRKNVSDECAAKAEEKLSALCDGFVERVKLVEKELEHAAHRQSSSLSYDEVKGVVDQSLEVYNADRVGLVDYAIEVAGGSIVYSLTSPTYYMSLSTRLSANVVPEAAIRANMNLGHCWPFKGDKGDIGIQLYPHNKVVANGISLEHAPRSIAHNIGSAPRDFEVWAYQHPEDGAPKKLFAGVYDIQNGKAVQTFKWHNVDYVVPIIQVRILSNFGHPIHTCVYRIRVHGIVSDQ